MLHQLEPPSQVLLGLSTAVTADALPYMRQKVTIQSAGQHPIRCCSGQQPRFENSWHMIDWVFADQLRLHGHAHEFESPSML